jgi:hypothetical protein
MARSMVAVDAISAQAWLPKCLSPCKAYGINSKAATALKDKL